jgi:hypothetical protein
VNIVKAPYLLILIVASALGLFQDHQSTHPSPKFIFMITPPFCFFLFSVYIFFSTEDLGKKKRRGIVLLLNDVDVVKIKIFM